ncbi:carbohydrate-binding module family 50 protein [Durotheca rogersii]|uniref:carbohydrate-binding module family 50 protein n=1 Tax=Durotheca rogersii TaxID=419775 RepID=UPI00221F0919|nr:carbohydrate-binding module family 50 protein [Durotheca rogersii]KAI5859895.1 carbohydrate-binding module family 50 protein [Durotheca rogersii]
MDPRYGNQGYQSQPQGEAASYYGGQPSPQPYSSYPGGPGGQQSYGQPDPQYQSSYQNQGPYGQSAPPNAGPGEDGERGLMGGLAGAAAGAYGGHKMGHGVIGAIAGAIAGHKLQDFVEDRKEKKDDGRHSPGSHGSHRDRSFGGHVGNFSSSSHDVHLEGDYDLRATCKRRDGGSQQSTLNLNEIISNEDGHFRWARGGHGGGGGSVTVQQGDTLRDIARRSGCSFEEIARINDISNPDMIYPGQTLRVPGQSGGNFSASARDVRLVDGGRVLEAELRNSRGDWRRSRIDLDEHITNQDGYLRYV